MLRGYFLVDWNGRFSADGDRDDRDDRDDYALHHVSADKECLS